MRIADRVRTHGNEVDVRSVEEISDFDPYEAVVFGGGVYDRTFNALPVIGDLRFPHVLGGQPPDRTASQRGCHECV